MKRFCVAVCLVGFLQSAQLYAQSVSAPLRPFVACKFEDGLAVVEKEPTPPTAAGRTVLTLLGPREVPIARGERILFGYPNKSPFVRATVEQIPAKGYVQARADLISAFDKLIASDDNVQRNYALKPQIDGFGASGLEKKELGGQVLGSYLLLDDGTRTAISIDFLNQPVDDRSFSSTEQYSALRDSFLASYTACVRANLRNGTTQASTSPSAKQPVKKVPARK